MRPPADPWGSPIDPVSPPPLSYGRAAVPLPPPALREPTTEMPVLPNTLVQRPVRTRSRGTTPQLTRPVSWQRTQNDTRRRLSDGWGFSAAGLLIAFCGWGLWAAAGRGTGKSPMPALILMLAVAILVFVVARFVGYVIIQGMLGRVRLHARWTHLTTGIFLTVSGITYFLSTSWLINSGDLVRDGLTWLGAHVPKS
jgi:hypothetical protein